MNKTLLIGNDINNINNATSWVKLLDKIIQVCGNNIVVSKHKPFPILYEEIYLKGLKSKNIKEHDLKSEIARIVGEIEPNEIHCELLDLDVSNYITTNYDYVLEKVLLKNEATTTIKNKGLIRETKYSVFRHNSILNKKFWHVHGEINVPSSIALGFEHYGGQLQQFRNYTVSGAKYKNKEISNIKSVHHRMKINELQGPHHSWIDLMFKDEVHILGLGLGYEETDLWWLLTNRARFQNEKIKANKNKIVYYSPLKYKNQDRQDIMNAYDIEIKYIDENDKRKYYQEVVNILKNE